MSVWITDLAGFKGSFHIMSLLLLRKSSKVFQMILNFSPVSSVKYVETFKDKNILPKNIFTQVSFDINMVRRLLNYLVPTYRTKKAQTGEHSTTQKCVDNSTIPLDMLPWFINCLIETGWATNPTCSPGTWEEMIVTLCRPLGLPGRIDLGCVDRKLWLVLANIVDFSYQQTQCSQGCSTNSFVIN